MAAASGSPGCACVPRRLGTAVWLSDVRRISRLQSAGCQDLTQHLSSCRHSQRAFVLVLSLMAQQLSSQQPSNTMSVLDGKYALRFSHSNHHLHNTRFSVTYFELSLCLQHISNTTHQLLTCVTSTYRRRMYYPSRSAQDMHIVL